MADAAPENPSNALSVAWTDVVQFVRQLSHDLRNYLNAADLTAAYLNEVGAEAEIKTEIKRLRDSIAAAARALQKLSAAITTPRITTIPYRASELIEDLRKKPDSEFPDRSAEIRELAVGFFAEVLDELGRAVWNGRDSRRRDGGGKFLQSSGRGRNAVAQPLDLGFDLRLGADLVEVSRGEIGGIQII